MQAPYVLPLNVFLTLCLALNIIYCSPSATMKNSNARNSELNALTHNIPLRSLLLSDVVRYGLSALYYTQVRRLSGICLELCEQDKPGAISQGRRGPEEKVCRRQPGEGVWERVICLIQNTVGGPESSAEEGLTHSEEGLTLHSPC